MTLTQLSVIGAPASGVLPQGNTVGTSSADNTDGNQGTLSTLELILQALANNKKWKSMQSEASATQPLPIKWSELRARSLQRTREELARAAKLGRIFEREASDLVRINLQDLEVIPTVVKGQIRHCAIYGDDASATHSKDITIIRRDNKCILAAMLDCDYGAPLANHGAKHLGNAALDIAYEMVVKAHEPLLSAEFISHLYQRLYIETHRLCCETKLSPAQAHDLFLAATLQLTIITPREVLILALDDGFVQRKPGDTLAPVVVRERIFEGSRVPPMLSAALVLDSASSNLQADFEAQRKRLIEQGQIALMHRLQANWDFARATHLEVQGLKVALYQPAEMLHANPLRVFTNGAIRTDDLHGRSSKVLTFPLRQLLDTLSASEVKQAINLWNFVAEPSAKEGSHQWTPTIAALCELLTLSRAEGSADRYEALGNLIRERLLRSADVLRLPLEFDSLAPDELLQQLLVGKLRDRDAARRVVEQIEEDTRNEAAQILSRKLSGILGRTIKIENYSSLVPIKDDLSILEFRKR